VAGVAAVGNARFPTSCPVASQGLPVRSLAASLFQASRLGIDLPELCNNIPRLLKVNMTSFGCVAMTGVATLGVGSLPSRPIASSGPPMLNMASFGGVATIGRRNALRQFSVVPSSIPWPTCAKYDVFWRCLNKWRPDARRRFSTVESSSIPWPTYARYDVFWRRRSNWCRDLRRR
jgi:hypothetical protein